jgi:exopolysaccharide biosynthesis WecB/TagA/CpsF family protein
MKDLGKRNLLGVPVDALDYEAAVAKIISAASEGRSFAVTALAVHGLMTGVLDPTHRFRLNQFDIVTPDGQPLRWALNGLYQLGLRDRVYGPTLSDAVCAAAAEAGLPVFFYGSREEVVQKLAAATQARYPSIRIAGYAPSRFRQLTPSERDELVEEIAGSGARILFVGLGCPRQEVFAFEMSHRLDIPILAVGAYFDYYSGSLKEPPMYLQRAGLQWLYRLAQEPRRLWKRYLVYNTQFVALILLQALGLWTPKAVMQQQPREELLYG